MIKKARVSDIFISKQGEGPYTGIQQIFIRFAGCSLNCIYCDTDTRIWDEYTVEELLKKVFFFDKEVHSVAITGGEPLEQVDLLELFLPQVKKAGFNIYLETNGLLHKALPRIIDQVDIIAMDIKLPSVMKRPKCWSEHSKFLKHAIKTEVFCKIVTSEDTSFEDLQFAGQMISEIDNTLETVIQPVSTPERVGEITVTQKKYKEILLRYLTNVNINPQMQRVWGIR